MLNLWVNLAVESAQLAVRLTRAWGLGLYDRTLPKWKTVGDTDEGPALKVAKFSKAQKATSVNSVKARHAAAAHSKSKSTRRSAKSRKHRN
jgi:hypothetical protein